MFFGELAMGLIILVVAIFLYANTFTFPTFEQYGMVDSDFWPKIILVLLIICSIMLVIETIRKRQALQQQSAEKRDDYDPKGMARMLLTVALLAFYIFIGLQYLGFLLSTLILVPALMYNLGNRKPIVIAINTLLCSGLAVLIFCKIMMIPLPRGMGIFRAFSLLFY